MSIKIYGMLDPHTHLRDLEWAHKATFASETRAALYGGYTAVFDMPNTPPTTTTAAALQTKLDALEQNAYCDYGVYFGASQAGNEDQYNQVKGVCGLKMFCNATTGDLLLDDQEQRASHVKAWNSGRVIAVHAEGETVLEILELVRQYRKPTHFLHISTAEEIAFLRAAKEENLPVTLGVCPHHLYLTQNDLSSLGPLGLMKPELKTEADRQALWEAIVDGLVDVVESDHAPHTLDEKHNAEGRPVYGVPGLETTLSLMLLAVQEGRITLEHVSALLAENPRRIFGVPFNAGTYTLIDPDYSYVIDRRRLQTACGWSPFEGARVYGRVETVVIRDRVAFDGERVLVPPGDGRNLFES